MSVPSLGGLEQFDENSGGIAKQDLLAARARDQGAPELDAPGAQSLDFRFEVID
ncbi:UNVERIFIED_CONTAM: hypothetical protein DES50_102551 [Williamsia faeni]